jgi:hypothetical protein
MSFLSGIRHSVARALHLEAPRNDDDVRRRQSAPTCEVDRFEKSARPPDTTWWQGRPLSEARNAHSTNTKEHFDEALKNGSNWLEGDVRKEIHGDTIEMRHDTGQESGDNLTLKEWLAKGKASGRGLKLDVKEGQHMDEIVREVREAGIPSERLMWNLGDADMAKWGPKLREQFPNSTMAINPTGSDGKISDGEVNRMIDLAKKAGPPTTFVVRFDRLTDSAIAKLKQHGTVSVWNEMGGVGVSERNVDDVTKRLRERGVDGVIDIRPTPDNWDKVGIALDYGKNKVGEVARSAYDNTLGRLF